MTEYECEVCGIVHVDDDGNEWALENYYDELTDEPISYPSVTEGP